MPFPIRPPYSLPRLQRVNTAGGRKYVTPTGNIWPSITTVLAEKSKGPIAAWRDRVGEAEAARIRKRATERGNQIHAMAESYLLEGTFDSSSPFHNEMFVPIQMWLDSNLDEIWHVEAALYSDDMGVAGTVDLIGLVKGRPAVLDFKTSTKDKRAAWIENYFMQCAAYSECYREITGITIDDHHVVITTESGNLQVFSGDSRVHLPEFIDLVGRYHSNLT